MRLCRSEVRASASRSTAGSVNSGYRGRNTVSVVMRAALGVDCNEPSAVGMARNWLPAAASKPAARTAVKIGAESSTHTGKTQNECSAAATPGHSTTNANRLANRRPSRAWRSSRSGRNVLSLRASRRSIAVGGRCRSCAINCCPGKLRTALLTTRSGSCRATGPSRRAQRVRSGANRDRRAVVVVLCGDRHFAGQHQPSRQSAAGRCNSNAVARANSAWKARPGFAWP